ncbi:glycosyltransferase [Polaribacter sp. Hel1_85]|uniref:glycosyltransferase n=1 Tax=Polaribacter sp. Hel1_85 TaxID=1250005 RepID=UPI00052E41E6|nr:glycosyltransferase [Polaribacter sp. Hel1_85]KGL63683.1 glycosyltransferase, GT2 family [Polaribacter sp. Hel1_85]
MILSVLFYSFVVFTAIQIIYYFVFTSFLFDTNKDKKKSLETPISVIICAKNEAKNLQEFLPSILNQKYNDFEVVLINDASSDETLEVMKSFEKKYNNIKIINVENIEAFWGNKKYALTLGIKAAKNDHLLFTDADCKPVSKHWIYEMTQNFNKDKTIVLGYGKYKKEKSLVNLFVRFETLLTAIQYFSYAKMGSPYMAVGRNLAYNRQAFFNVKGFINHMHIKSGDDDLFIQDAANKENTTIATSKDSFTESLPPKSFAQWFRQKRRHISTANHYKFKHKFFLGLFFISKVFLYILAITLFFFYPWKIVLPIFLTYYLIQFIVIGLSSKKLEEPTITYLLPFLEIGLLIFHFSIFITNLASKPNHWK